MTITFNSNCCLPQHRSIQIAIDLLTREALLISVCVAFALIFCVPRASAQSDDDDMLLYLPAMIASPPRDVCTAEQLRGLRANTRARLVCSINLGGRTLELASGIKLQAINGTLRNGTVTFSGNGFIDGELLNSSLTVLGAPQLLEPVFNFVPSRWSAITQGQTTADRAFRNNQELERLFFMIKRMGGTTFKIDRFDAYFEARMTPPDRFVFRPSKEAVNLPSNFTLSMSNQTHLRVFPASSSTPANELKGGAILAVRDEENILISGGNLHGDRDQRYYSPQDDGQEGSHLFSIRSGRNVTLRGIKFFKGSKGSININSFGFTFNPDYKPTRDLIIENCLFQNSRRMSIALTDGRDIQIRNNRFINNGLPSSNSDGGEVGYAINIEPGRRRNDAGELEELQKVVDTEIYGNTESGSRGGFVTLTIGQRLTVRDNTIGSRVVTSLVNDSKVINNRFTAVGTATSSFAIFVAGGQSDTVFNNLVANNQISGYSSGIIATSVDATIRDNVITNVSLGLQSGRSKNVRFIDNTISSSSRGINTTNTYNDGVEFIGNEITATTGFHIYVANVNKGAEHLNKTMLFSGNTTNGDRAVVVSNATGITLQQNQFKSGVQVSNTNKVTVSNNTIRPHNFHGIRLFNGVENTTISNNTIFEPTGDARYNCLQNDTTSSTNLIISANTCN